jgi:hypothetical protein
VRAGDFFRAAKIPSGHLSGPGLCNDSQGLDLDGETQKDRPFADLQWRGVGCGHFPRRDLASFFLLAALIFTASPDAAAVSPKRPRACR